MKIALYISIILFLNTILNANENFIPTIDSKQMYIKKLANKYPSLIKGLQSTWETEWEVAHGNTTDRYKNIAYARYNIGESYRGIEERDTAEMWYLSAINYSDKYNNGSNSYAPQYQLGMINKHRKDYSLAFEYFLDSAKKHNYSQYELGLAYKNGYGTIKNYIEAYAWFNICSAHTSSPYSKKSKLEIKQLEMKMTKESVIEGQLLSKEYYKKLYQNKKKNK